jgi:hypothetical protein
MNSFSLIWNIGSVVWFCSAIICIFSTIFFLASSFSPTFGYLSLGCFILFICIAVRVFHKEKHSPDFFKSFCKVCNDEIIDFPSPNYCKKCFGKESSQQSLRNVKK